MHNKLVFSCVFIFFQVLNISIPARAETVQERMYRQQLEVMKRQQEMMRPNQYGSTSSTYVKPSSGNESTCDRWERMMREHPEKAKEFSAIPAC